MIHSRFVHCTVYIQCTLYIHTVQKIKTPPIRKHDAFSCFWLIYLDLLLALALLSVVYCVHRKKYTVVHYYLWRVHCNLVSGWIFLKMATEVAEKIIAKISLKAEEVRILRTCSEPFWTLFRTFKNFLELLSFLKLVRSSWSFLNCCVRIFPDLKYSSLKGLS